MTTGEKIRYYRKQNGMTMRKLAEMVGVKFSAINKYEKGIVTNIPIDRIVQIAEALSIPPKYLVDWFDEPDDKDSIIPGFMDEIKQMNKLTSDEQLLLDIFRTMTADKQSELLRIAMRLKMDSERK